MIRKILIISHLKEDALNIKKLIETDFEQFEILIINRLDQVQEEIYGNKQDIILFDIDFPDNSKSEISDIIRIISSETQIPLIALSKIADYKEILNAGATNFILKPFSEITLLSNLKTAINLLDRFKEIEQHKNEIYEKDQWIQSQIENEHRQRDIIVKKNQEIMADIRYASRIQQAILPRLDFMNNNIKEYFILHQPKSHVSGDFYWVNCKDDLKTIAVGDCTGHGISGALMHMLGAVYLSEITSNHKSLKANEIINKLRDYIMKSLNQTGESGEAQDGMDIALCIIDYKTMKLQFCGANNPLYIIRDKELIEIKGDRMPVGIHINFDKSFTNHEFDLKSGDQLYLFSDGYADQFGGAKGKKFRYKQFKELMVSNSHLPMNIQKEILNNVHDKWRGNLDQIDDILVFGLKIE